MVILDAYGHRKDVPDSWDQDFEIELDEIPVWENLGRRANQFVLRERKRKQKAAILDGLRRCGVRPELPCTIVLIRVGVSELDDDNVPGSMKYIRDTIATEWMGLKSDRRPGLRWLYGQQKTRRRVPVPGKKRGRGYLAVRVTIINREIR